MRPADIMVIGLLIWVLGTAESARDGKLPPNTVVRLLGVAIVFGGWTWQLSSWGLL